MFPTDYTDFTDLIYVLFVSSVVSILNRRQRRKTQKLYMTVAIVISYFCAFCVFCGFFINGFYGFHVFSLFHSFYSMMSINIRLVRYKSRSIYFEYKDVVHDPYRATVHKLYPSLMAQCVNGETYAVAGIYVPRLGEETDVEWQSRHICRCLWRIKTSDTLPCARVIPLPLLHIAAKFGVGLCDAHA